MTEFWVSQGNKWCDFCKIFISNNPASIRNHELGKKHKDNVANKIDNMRKESAAKDKEHKEALRTLEQIEAKAKRSYQKDIATFRENSSNHALDVSEDGQEKWEFDNTSGYYFNPNNGLYYDPNSGFYYSDGIGKWVTQQEAYAAVQAACNSKQKGISTKKSLFASSLGPVSVNKNASKVQSGSSPASVVSSALKPMKTFKGAATSSLAVNKRKRSNEKPKVISEEEKAALKAREAAKKRVQDREKPLLGLYKH